MGRKIILYTTRNILFKNIIYQRFDNDLFGLYHVLFYVYRLSVIIICVVLFIGVLEMSAATESGIRLSGHTLDKATKAKVTLENYYSNLIAQHIERKQRYSIQYVYLIILIDVSDF